MTHLSLRILTDGSLNPQCLFMSVNTMIKIRLMDLTDLPQAMNLSQNEGWNQTERDWRLLLDNPENKCLVAVYRDKVIGTATAINYSDLEVWIGMVLVDKDLRRQGIGSMLVEAIIGLFKGIKSVKLDATPAGIHVYEKIGFIEERLLYRMVCHSFKGISYKEIESGPEPVRLADLDELIELDKEIFGVGRRSLLETIIRNYQGKAFLLRRNGKISGYILGRDGVRYNYTGPVFVSSWEDARELVSEAFHQLKNKDIAIDVHADKLEMINWLEDLGFIRQRHFTRMYLGHNPFPGYIENQYFIAGPEYG